LFNLEAAESLPAGIVSNLWPGDTTVYGGYYESSLYEYVGTGNSTPSLVGVDNEGKLISQCGTFLGAVGNRSHHNAVSVDGSTVFFTSFGADDYNCGGTEPAVDEIFARVNGSQTIAISVPSPNSGCSEPSCTGAALEDASFEGASQDGSKVLFTSTRASAALVRPSACCAGVSIRNRLRRGSVKWERALCTPTTSILSWGGGR
jgi:hypothetical protein